MIDFADLIIITLVAVAVSIATIIALSPEQKHAPPPPKRGTQDAIFLFDNDILVDACSTAEEFLRSYRIHDQTWSALHHVLASRFASLPATLPSEATVLPMIFESQDAGGASYIYVEAAGKRIRVSLHERLLSARNALQLYQQRGREGQVDRLHTAVNCAPYPIWQTTTNGRIIWANAAYQNLLEACGKTIKRDAHGVTYPMLFHQPGRNCRQRDRYRAFVTLTPGEDTLWYEVNAVRNDLHTMHFATDINAIVQSEKTQREFVQTLTKTFAQLSVGLAVFNQKRELTLFNPALTDLTGLAPAFLAKRPSLRALFDALRDAQIMPEPRDYHSWHENIAALIDAATDGSYLETWTLPSGQMYRVCGKPHPDGAIVFLFEDISAEISLSRKFRAEMTLNQSVIDQFDQPLAVFSSTGHLQIKNAAYDRHGFSALPSNDAHANDIVAADLSSCLQIWHGHSNTEWDLARLQRDITKLGPAALSGLTLSLNDGTECRIFVRKIAGGASMVCFAPLNTETYDLELTHSA